VWLFILMASSEGTQGTCSTQQGSTNVQKLKVTIDVDGRAIGENAPKWNSRVGHYVRVNIPISYEDFRKVDPHFRNEVWKGLMVSLIIGFYLVIGVYLVPGT
ncbi:hypothetical protein FRX31_033595, partial [Thalictrum thalictroides]